MMTLKNCNTKGKLAGAVGGALSYSSKQNSRRERSVNEYPITAFPVRLPFTPQQGITGPPIYRVNVFQGTRS
jgi:hypothetical protein